jgi:hypothetical protein
MKLTILLLSVSLAALTSCTTSYKTGQTPDDVYYSPTRPQEEYVQRDQEEEQPNRYEDQYYEDRYLRMKVRNRNRWNDLDDWYYSDYRNRYNVYLGCCFCTNTWSPYSHWNNYYNPYYQNYVIIKNVNAPVYSKPRTFNLNTYNSNPQTTRNYNPVKYGSPSNTSNSYSNPRNVNTNRSNSSGNRLRNVFENNSSSSSSSSGSNSSSSSSSSGSSSNNSKFFRQQHPE